MSPDPKNDLLYLLEIIQSAEKIKRYAENFNSADDFWEANDQMNFNAVLTLLTQIGELSAKVSEFLRQNNPQIPWRTIKNFRNRAVHDYAGLNVFIVFQTIRESIPELESQVYTLIQKGLKEKQFDYEEFQTARKSNYYAWVNFSKISL